MCHLQTWRPAPGSRRLSISLALSLSLSPSLSPSFHPSLMHKHAPASTQRTPHTHHHEKGAPCSALPRLKSISPHLHAEPRLKNIRTFAPPLLSCYILCACRYPPKPKGTHCVPPSISWPSWGSSCLGISRRFSPSRPHPQPNHVGPSRSVRLLPGGCGAGVHHPACRLHGAHPARHRELRAHEHGQEPPPALRGVQARRSPGVPTRERGGEGGEGAVDACCS